MSPVKYELRFYIPEDGIHSGRLENLKSNVTGDIRNELPILVVSVLAG
jgi:hypothetical protein